MVAETAWNKHQSDRQIPENCCTYLWLLHQLDVQGRRSSEQTQGKADHLLNRRQHRVEERIWQLRP